MRGAKFQVATMIWTFQTGEGSITNIPFRANCCGLGSVLSFSSIEIFFRSESESEFGFCEDRGRLVDLFQSKTGIRRCVFDRQSGYPLNHRQLSQLIHRILEPE